MKNLFPGYNRKSEGELKQLWSDCIFVFDANVLLSLYRYTETTKDSILDLISSFPERVWLPHQAALEFNRNRYELIAEQKKLYKKHEIEISKTLDELSSNNKPPFFSASTIKSLEVGINKLKTEVHHTIEKFENYYKNNDPIYEKLVSLFDHKVTEPFSVARLKEIFEEGEIRYKEMVPPGFEDAKNKRDDRKFGDLIIWFQTIDLALKLNRNVVFITDDQKVDWYWKLTDGNVMGPRHELVAEMKEKANVDFHIYTSEGFLKFGQDFLNQDIDNVATNEIKALNESLRDDNLVSFMNFFNNINTVSDLPYQKKYFGSLDSKMRLIGQAIDEKLIQLETYRINEHSEKDQQMLKIQGVLEELYAKREKLEKLAERPYSAKAYHGVRSFLENDFRNLRDDKDFED